jgi:hypothetical protein
MSFFNLESLESDKNHQPQHVLSNLSIEKQLGLATILARKLNASIWVETGKTQRNLTVEADLDENLNDVALQDPNNWTDWQDIVTIIMPDGARNEVAKEDLHLIPNTISLSTVFKSHSNAAAIEKFTDKEA